VQIRMSSSLYNFSTYLLYHIGTQAPMLLALYRS
jgi:hypothetical protein